MAKVLNQDDLLKALRHLFPGTNILVNSRKVAKLKNPSSNLYLEIDLWIPDLRIGFEFQDSYHYASSWYSHYSLEQVQRKDNIKKKYVEHRGDTLIVVPCWWDGSHESLIATIRARRKDLLRDHQTTADPIELIPPEGFFSKGTIVPGVGELMLASFPASHEFFVSVLAPWWLGEKYDGIRCCWNSDNKQMYNRSGGAVRLPDEYFKSINVSCFIDGELWLGRGTFLDLQTYGIAHSAFLRIITFDDPAPGQNNMPFEERYATLLSNIAHDHPLLIIPSRALCIDKIHLSKSINALVKDEGEGVILQTPKSFYERGRSTSLMKLKAVRADREALVTRVNVDGSCLLQLPNGLRFKAVNPKKGNIVRGDVVTFSYQSNFGRLARPVLPIIERVRTELVWEDVIREFLREIPKPQVLNVISSDVMDYQAREQGDLTKAHSKRKRIRAFFENIAKRKGKDPLLPETWYSFRPSYIRERLGAKEMLKYFDGSFVKAVMYVFPEIGLDSAKFPYVPNKHWASITHRRNFFDNFARQRRLDPLNPTTWYNISSQEISDLKGGPTLMSFYCDSYIRMITHIYPEIGLRETGFSNITRNYWKDKTHQKEAFDKYAQSQGFDPLVASNWYSITYEAASAYKGVLAILPHYEASFAKALSAIYPTLSLDESKFGSRWNFGTEKSRRKYLLKYAERRGFDPLVPANWYPISADQFKSYGGGTSALLYYYNGSFVNALLHLLPNIGLDAQQFSIVPHNHWTNPENRRLYFERFAKSRGFDPLIASNWYSVTSTELANSMVPGSSSMITVCGTIAAGVMEAFPDIGLIKDHFATHSTQYWAKPENQRNFFLKFAKQRKFDPLNADNWYPITAQDLAKQRDSNAIHTHFQGSYVNALMELFPEVNLDRKKFVTLSRRYWTHPINCRRVFLQFSEANKFDPLLAENWVKMDPDHFLAFKDAREMLEYGYDGSVASALAHLFPNLGLGGREDQKGKE